MAFCMIYAVLICCKCITNSYKKVLTTDYIYDQYIVKSFVNIYTYTYTYIYLQVAGTPVVA